MADGVYASRTVDVPPPPEREATVNAWVYHGRAHRAKAAELVEKLRASKEYGLVLPASSRYYRGEIHRGDVVYHDGSRRDLVWINEREGIECRQFAGSEMGSDVVAPEPEADEDEVPTGQVVTAAGPVEEVRRSGMWFTAYRGGEKVGKAQKSEAEAWALLKGPTGGAT